MPSTKTSYDKAGTVTSTTQREGIDIGPRPDFFADLARLQSMMRPRADVQAQSLRASGPRLSPADLAGPNLDTVWGGGPRTNPDEELLKQMQVRQAMIELQQQNQPPPMRMVSGAQIRPGYAMDPNAMSAYQRKLFLPQSSGVAPDYARREQFEENAFERTPLPPVPANPYENDRPVWWVPSPQPSQQKR